MSLPDLDEPLALLEQKELDAAIDMLEHKVNEIPAHIVGHLLLARAYEAQEQWQQALESWENVHFLMPNSPVAGEGKRRVLRRMDELEAEGDDHASPVEQNENEPASPEEEQEPSPADSSVPAPAEDADAVEEGEDDDLEALRRQAEREALQGGGRADISGESDAEESSPSPEDRIEQLEKKGDAGDLDRLINELESARIEPDPEAEDAPPPNLEDDTEDVVSETLARIHENQGNYGEAARIYARLAEEEPDRAQEFTEKAAELRERANESDTDE